MSLTCRYLLLVLATLLLTSCDAKTFRLGVLIPFNGLRALGRVTAGAVTVAVDDVNRDKRFSALRSRGHNVTFVWRDTENRLDTGLYEFVNLWASSLQCEQEDCDGSGNDDCTGCDGHCRIDAFIGE